MAGLSIGMGLLGGGCQGSGRAGSHGADWTPRAAADLGAEVARVAGQPIFASEVVAEAVRNGGSSAEALGRVIDFHLIAERARRFARPALPEDRDRKRLMVERFVEREFEAVTRPEQVPEAQLREVYKRNETRFVHPRLVEVALLSVYTGPGMKPAPRARAKETGYALFAHVSGRPGRTPEDFQAVAADPDWKSRKVSFWRFVQGPTRKYGPFNDNVAGRIVKLTRPGETSELIVDDSGYHIARFVAEVPPKNIPFEAARAELLAGFYEPWRQQRFFEWTGKLAALHETEIYATRVAPGAPSRTAR